MQNSFVCLVVRRLLRKRETFPVTNHTHCSSLFYTESPTDSKPSGEGARHRSWKTKGAQICLLGFPGAPWLRSWATLKEHTRCLPSLPLSASPQWDKREDKNWENSYIAKRVLILPYWLDLLMSFRFCVQWSSQPLRSAKANSASLCLGCSSLDITLPCWVAEECARLTNPLLRTPAGIPQILVPEQPLKCHVCMSHKPSGISLPFQSLCWKDRKNADSIHSPSSYSSLVPHTLTYHLRSHPPPLAALRLCLSPGNQLRTTGSRILASLLLGTTHSSLSDGRFYKSRPWGRITGSLTQPTQHVSFRHIQTRGPGKVLSWKRSSMISLCDHSAISRQWLKQLFYKNREVAWYISTNTFIKKTCRHAHFYWI